MLEWDDLRNALEVHRRGTLTAAAEALSVTRTTVGRRLRQAESRLGVRLFDRTPEGLLATAAGRDLIATAERVEAEVLAAEGRALGHDVAMRGPLRVSTVDFVYEGFASVFASFVERYPDIELTVADTDGVVSLLRREADVVVRLDNAPAEHLVGRRLLRMRFGLYAARSLAERIGLQTPLSGWPWLGWDKRSDEALFFDAWIARHAPGARVVMRGSTFAVIRRSIREGVGVLFLPTHIGNADSGLVSLDVELTDEARDLWALCLAELKENRRVRAFLDHAYTEFPAVHSRTPPEP